MTKKYYFKSNPLSPMVFDVYCKNDTEKDGEIKEEIVLHPFELNQDEFLRKIDKLIDDKCSIIKFTINKNTLNLEYIDDNPNRFSDEKFTIIDEQIEFDSKVLEHSYFNSKLEQLHEKYINLEWETKANIVDKVHKKDAPKSINEQTWNIIYQYMNNESIGKTTQKDIDLLYKNLSSEEALKIAKEIYLNFEDKRDMIESLYDTLFSLSTMSLFVLPLYTYYKSDNIIEMIASLVATIGVTSTIMLLKNHYITDKSREILEQIKEKLSKEYRIDNNKSYSLTKKQKNMVSNLTHI